MTKTLIAAVGYCHISKIEVMDWNSTFINRAGMAERETYTAGYEVKSRKSGVTVEVFTYTAAINAARELNLTVAQ